MKDLTDVYSLYDERRNGSRGVIDIWMIVAIASICFFLSYYVSTVELPAWLGGGPTKEQLAQDVVSLEKSLEDAKLANNSLAESLELKDDLVVIDNETRMEHEAVVVEVKATAIKIKETVIKKTEQVKADTSLTEPERDDLYLEALIEGMQLAHANLPSVKLTQKVVQ